MGGKRGGNEGERGRNEGKEKKKGKKERRGRLEDIWVLNVGERTEDENDEKVWRV